MFKYIHAFSFAALITSAMYCIGIMFFALFTKASMQAAIMSSVPMSIALVLLFVSLPGLIHWGLIDTKDAQ